MAFKIQALLLCTSIIYGVICNIYLDSFNATEPIHLKINPPYDGSNFHDYQTSLTQNGINFTNLLYEYVLTCGFEKLCHPSQLDFYVKLNYTYKDSNFCPPCSCEKECIQHGDCCPDKTPYLFFSSCVDVTLMKSKKLSDEFPSQFLNTFHIINKCGPESNETLHTLCERRPNVTESLVNPPLLSDDGISYYNKHCAICHGAINKLFTNWRIDIECERFADFNYILSYDDVVKLAEQRACLIKYTPPFNYSQTCLDDKTRRVITTCNVTGGWQTYDADIDFACNSSYYVPFRRFKNVFCFMCNPDVGIDTQKISECNKTGTWIPYDPALQEVCDKFESTYSTGRFKNIFCFFCNKHISHNSIYEDVNAIIKEKTVLLDGNQNSVEYQYSIDVLSFKFNKDYRIFFKQREISPRQRREVFIPNLVSKAFSTNNTLRYCNVNINRAFSNISSDFERCSCDYDCLFTNKTCCLDETLMQSTSCFDQEFTTQDIVKSAGTRFLAINGCRIRNYVGYVIKQKCETGLIDGVDTFLPVYKNGVLYRNLNCFICNEIHPSFDLQLKKSITSAKPFDVQILCANKLDYLHLSKIIDIILMAQKQKCRIRYVPPKDNIHPKNDIKPRVCLQNQSLIGRCNITGYWIDHDDDVIWACENIEEVVLPPYGKFKNIFCFICNPSYSNETVLSQCNITGKWDIYDSNIGRACQVFPTIQALYPFKNVFCMLCNQENSTLIDRTLKFYSRYTVVLSTTISTIHRYLFGISQFLDDARIENSKDMCRKSEIYDSKKDICRRRECYPGKILNNNTCIPLFETTSNLKYILSFSGKSKVPVNNATMEQILNILTFEIKHTIMSIVNLTHLEFESFYLLTNVSCSEEIEHNQTADLNINVHTTIFIQNYVARMEVENSLLSFTQQNFTLNITNRNVTFQIFNDEISSFLPNIIHKLDLQRRCYKMYTHEVSSNDHYISSYVSKLLICPQVELQPDEFTVDLPKLLLKLTYADVQFRHNEFQMIDADRARVCSDLFSQRLEKLEMKTKITSCTEKVSNILSLICTCISIVCLIVTFFTYCCIPSLRTLPGKNNMSLVISMLFAQGFLQFGILQTNDDLRCLLTGVFIHYFWLAMFFCMNVCTFHMYRVFLRKTVAKSMTSENNVFKRYLLYAYGFPFVIVTSCVGFNFLLTGNSGYGKRACFISELLPYILTFFIPIILICLSNIVMFVKTIFNIKHTPKISSNHENRKDIWIYIKLFSITGIMWTVMVIDSFLEYSYFSIMIGVLNGLQGLFIMVSYVVNKRVKRSYQKLLNRNTSSSSSSSTTVNMKTWTLSSANTPFRTKTIAKPSENMIVTASKRK